MLQIPGNISPSSLAIMDLPSPSKVGALSAASANAPTLRTEKAMPGATEGTQPGSYADLDLGPADPVFGGGKPELEGSTAAGTRVPIRGTPPPLPRQANEERTAVARPDRGDSTAPLPAAPRAAPRRKPGRPVVATAAAEDVTELANGLKLTQIALFFLAVPFFCLFAQAIYFMFNPLELEERTKAGFLGLTGFTFWDELRLVFIVLSALAFYGLLLPGRVMCLQAPPLTQARWLVGAALGFTIASCLAGVLYGIAVFLRVQNNPMPDTEFIAKATWLTCAILAELWFCVFIAQLGWPLGSPRLLRETAWFLCVVVLVPAGLWVVDHFYPIFGSIQEQMNQAKYDKGKQQDIENTHNLMLFGSLLAGAVLISFRYMATVSTARKAVDRFRKQAAPAPRTA
ncbi:MAG TPA: hypothetical protein VKE94_06300 [Gemmataceae bacterium]|nr:hypothetical protein [Gemmataceae bacterium]